jgi:hypothetical protein
MNAKTSEAAEVISTVGNELQSWVKTTREKETAKGKHWVFTASAPSGQPMIVHTLSPHHETMIKLDGQFFDGRPCMLMAHCQEVQFLALFADDTQEAPEQPEIGFHTLIVKRTTLEP